LTNLREIAIPLTTRADGAQIERAIDDAIADSGLDVALRASLTKFPGCTHWHLKRGSNSGTLEITFWPQEKRAWFSIQSRREADWIEAAIRMLNNEIQRRAQGI
jgi:hypothetical protein